MQIHGIIPPVATPMRPDEGLDLPRFRWFLDHLLAAGVHGLFVLGTNGEAYALTDKERQELIATAIAHVQGRVPVIVGTGSITTGETLRLTRIAEREGADAISVITPYFIRPSQAELLEHYRRVAENTHLPVLLYNNPDMTSVKLHVDSVARLAELPNIIGIKDSSGDLQNTNEYVRVVPKRFAVLQGRDSLIYPSLLCGARGAVPASANVAPEVCVAIYTAVQSADHEAAKAAQARLAPLRLSLSLATAPGGVKAALSLLGRSIGPCRAPIGPLSAESEQAMRATLRRIGLLP